MMCGRLTRDPKSEHFPSGTHRVEFGIAVPEGYSDKEKPMFFTCQAWNKSAEFCAKLKKGQAVIVEGRTCREEWTDADGKSKKATRIKCDYVQTLEWDDRIEPDKADEGDIPF